MDQRIPLFLGAYLFYMVFFMVAVVSLWAASNLLDFRNKTFRLALKMMLVYFAFVSIPHSGIILLFVFFSSNIKLEVLSSLLLVSIIVLSQLLQLFLIKHFYQESWQKVLSAYLFYIIMLLGLFIILSLLQVYFGLKLTGFGLYSAPLGI